MAVKSRAPKRTLLKALSAVKPQDEKHVPREGMNPRPREEETSVRLRAPGNTGIVRDPNCIRCRAIVKPRLYRTG